MRRRSVGEQYADTARNAPSVTPQAIACPTCGVPAKSRCVAYNTADGRIPRQVGAPTSTHTARRRMAMRARNRKATTT